MSLTTRSHVRTVRSGRHSGGGARGRARSDPDRRILDGLPVCDRGRRGVRPQQQVQDPDHREHRHRRRHEAVLRRRGRAAPGHHQRLAPDQADRGRSVRRQRRQGDHRGEDRLRRDRDREREEVEALRAHAPAAVPRAREAGPRARAADWSRTRTRPGRTSTPSLPNAKIEVLGPPPTSGTRDAFNELVIEGGCNAYPELKALKDKDEAQLQVDLPRRARGRRLRRGGRERQPDRAEARGESQRARRVRLQLPRSEHRPDPGQHRRRRGADVREHRERQVPGVAAAVHLREERAREVDPGHPRVRGGIHQREGDRRRGLSLRARPDPGAEARSARSTAPTART